MRALVQRPFAFVVVGLAAALSGAAFAQADSPQDVARATSPTEETEEITVRGRKTLDEYRLELEEAREELIAVFNEENSSDTNDVTCRDERPTGSRMPQRVCRSKAQSDAEASSARWFLNALTTSAGRYPGEGGAGAAPFQGGPQLDATVGAGEAQGDVISGTADARARVEAELERLKRENRRLHRAALKYIELDDEYNRAREEMTR